MDRDSVGGITTHYVLDDPRIEARWKTRFFTPVQTGTGAHPASYEMGTRFHSRAVMLSGSGVNQPSLVRVEVKERVELYLYSPLGFQGMF